MYTDSKIMLIYNHCLIIKLRSKFTNEFFYDSSSGYEYLPKVIKKVTGFNHHILSLMKLILEQCPEKRLHNEDCMPGHQISG